MDAAVDYPAITEDGTYKIGYAQRFARRRAAWGRVHPGPRRQTRRTSRRRNGNRAQSGRAMCIAWHRLGQNADDIDAIRRTSSAASSCAPYVQWQNYQKALEKQRERAARGRGTRFLPTQGALDGLASTTSRRGRRSDHPARHRRHQYDQYNELARSENMPLVSSRRKRVSAGAAAVTSWGI